MRCIVSSVRPLGDLLRERREARGFSLQSVASSTKIREHILVALESGTYDCLPAPVFVRGFLRTLARHLGLDADELLALYVAAVPQSVASSAVPTPINGGGYASGHTNGHAHANGNGHPNASALANGNAHANGNGHPTANAHTNGNGQPNGTVHAIGNGHTNGHGTRTPTATPTPTRARTATLIPTATATLMATGIRTATATATAR